MKLTAGILLVYTQDEIFWQNKQCKRKIPYSRPVLLIFLSSREETELMDALKCWAKSILSQCVIQQQFFKVSKWVIFGYGEVCVHGYTQLATIYMYIIYILYTYILYVYYIVLYTDILYLYPSCDGVKSAESWLAKCYLQLTLNS